MTRAMLWQIEVLGDPQAQPRARATPPPRRGVYTPDTADEWKDAVRAALVAHLLAGGDGAGVLPLGAPTAFGYSMAFRFTRPKSHWRTGRNAHLLRASAPPHHTPKPDFDNLEKAVLDAISAWGDLLPLLWLDDSQACYVFPSLKRWAQRDEPAGLTLALWTIE